MSKHDIFFRMSWFALLIFLFISFNNCSGPIENEKNYSYEIYYLSDSSLSYFDVDHIGLNYLILKNKPFFTANDIEKFIVLYLKDNPICSYGIILKDSVDILYSNKVRPFVLLLNGERYYMGEYWPSFMSIIPKSINMFKAFDREYHLQPGDEIGNAKLKDPIILNALKNLGVKIEYVNIGG
jgi:hypothetical protein